MNYFIKYVPEIIVLTITILVVTITQCTSQREESLGTSKIVKLTSDGDDRHYAILENGAFVKIFQFYVYAQLQIGTPIEMRRSDWYWGDKKLDSDIYYFYNGRKIKQ